MKLVVLLLMMLLEFRIIGGQWTEAELRRMIEETNVRHSEIERMTKEAAIRHNQMGPEGSQAVSIPPPVPPPPRQIIRPAPPPTIEDDRTFLAKMSEQEALVNQLNSIATREAISRNGLLVMEGALLNALRPLAYPFMEGQPIPGHFVPFQRMARPIEQSPIDNRVEIQSRPIASQLPMREISGNLTEF